MSQLRKNLNVNTLHTRILLPDENTIHPYMMTFAQACLEFGIEGVKDICVHRKIRALIGRMGLTFNFGANRRRLICLGSGRIESVSWPWCYFNEIVPVMWDVWPEYVQPLNRFIKRNKVRLMFCTSRQQSEYMQRLNPAIKVVWIPEGVDVALYPQGPLLKERGIDILEYGRRLAKLHGEFVQYFQKRSAVHKFERIGPDFKALTATIRDAKIAVCYPQCDTNPQRAGNVETLTQRYWECMLSGTLICGRSPKELVDICGYDPCVTLGDSPCEQVQDILEHINDYQRIVDRNRETALSQAPWRNRVNIVLRALREAK